MHIAAPPGTAGTAEAVWKRILDASAAGEAIDFAYPTQGMCLNPVLGKPGARAALPPLSREPGKQ